MNFGVTPRHPPLHQLSHDEALLLVNINHSTQQHSKIPETSQVIPSWSLSLHSYAYLFIFPNHSETSHQTAEGDQREIPALTLAA